MNQHLRRYIEHCQEFDKNKFLIVLDRDLVAVFAGTDYLTIGGKTHDEVIGKHIHQTAKIPPENIKPSLDAFNKAITQNKIIPVIISNLLHKTQDMIQIFGATISPINEPDSNFVVGLRFEFYWVKLETFFETLIRNVTYVEKNNLPDNDSFLTHREHQIAFLLFYCKDYTEISQVISIFENTKITEKTTRNIVSRYLYPKFEVYSLQELMQKLKQNDYHQKIPNSLQTNRFLDLSQ
ncbi:MAG: hypothetical protein PHC75_07690 [Burkholderiales bacterium]|nr:hypothetical protein [Burkholderiales bacterium]